MVDALNRLDQTDALVEQILGDSKVGACQPWSRAFKQLCAGVSMEAETTTSSEANHHKNHKASSDTKSDQLDWDPEKLMMTVTPWWTKTGPPWYPHHGKDLWTRMKRVR